MKFDLNCDLGEGERTSRTVALSRWLTSVNVACGGHAGTVGTMEECIGLAVKFGLRVGAHPGLVTNHGRGEVAAEFDGESLQRLLVHQVGGFEMLCQGVGVKLHHIKLHGALYHAVERNAELGSAYLAAVKKWWPKTIIYSRAGGTVARMAESNGVRVWQEGFLDRSYLPQGELVPRGMTNALVTRPKEIRERVERLISKGEILAIDSTPIKMSARTLCIHSDTPNALALVRTARYALEHA